MHCSIRYRELSLAIDDDLLRAIRKESRFPRVITNGRSYRPVACDGCGCLVPLNAGMRPSLTLMPYPTVTLTCLAVSAAVSAAAVAVSIAILSFLQPLGPSPTYFQQIFFVIKITGSSLLFLAAWAVLFGPVLRYSFSGFGITISRLFRTTRSYSWGAVCIGYEALETHMTHGGHRFQAKAYKDVGRNFVILDVETGSCRFSNGGHIAEFEEFLSPIFQECATYFIAVPNGGGALHKKTTVKTVFMRLRTGRLDLIPSYIHVFRQNTKTP